MTTKPTNTATTTTTTIKVNPQDVSTILFQKNTNPPLTTGRRQRIVVVVEPYVGPVKISCNDKQVAHGRGLVATRTIAAGELLFAIPPTVEASLEVVYEKWLEQRKRQSQQRQQQQEDNDDDYFCLEACAEEVLLDTMQQAWEQQPAIAASFAALVASPDDVNHSKLPSIPTLLGTDEKAGKEASSSLHQMTRDHMLKIVRANAFGPDGLHSYQNIEKQWIQAQKGISPIDNDPTKVKQLLLQQTTRLLGLYPLADMVNHACLANAVRVYAAGNIMLVHALVEIPCGTEIVYSYVPPSQPHRRPVLQKQHGFTCQCSRCIAEEQVEPVLQKSEDTISLLALLKSWNHTRLAQFPSYSALHKAIRSLEDDVLPLPELTNEVRRYLRISYLHVYIHYFNAALTNLQVQTDDLVANILRNDLLTLATQLHFSFCACHNASTEHLSILHLCYELVGRQAASLDQGQAKVRFWTEQLKKAHMLRYGNLGHDINHVRRVMQHSRALLRQTQGWHAVEYSFL